MAGHDELIRLTERMEYYATPGVSITVIADGEIVWSRCYGVLEDGTVLPVTEDTLFQVGSISKPVTAVAIMRLVQEGVIDLDEDVNRYLKSWRVPPNGAWQPRITTAMLLRHFAGTTVNRQHGYRRNRPMPTLVEILNGERPANTSAVIVDTLPGLMFQYSGGGYAILQQLLVDVLQQPFPELMHDLVLEPLGMRLSTFDQPLPEDRHSNAATAHPYGARPLIDKWHVYPEMASQGLWSTPSEIALVAIELQRAVAGRSALGLSPELVDKTLTEPGLGLFIQGEGENKRFVHPGWGHGYMSEMVAYKHKGIGAVVMRNSSQGQMEFSAEVLRGIAQVYDWPDYLPVDLEIPSVNLNLSQYAGRYRLDSGDIAEVTVRGGALALSLLGQSPFELLPARDGTFFSKSLRGKTTFSADKEGAVTKIVFSTDWVYREAYRIS